VQNIAKANAEIAAKYYSGNKEDFVENVKAGAIYHDLGKVDEANQNVLKVESKKSLPMAHEDAGAASLLNLKRIESAIFVAAHHQGLFGQGNERSKGDKPFRNLKVAQYVDAHLKDYIQKHKCAGLPILEEQQNTGTLNKCGFTRRIALSCLVDADYFDTAKNYGNETVLEELPTRWEERIAALEEYISNLPKGHDEREKERNHLRKEFYELCKITPINSNLSTCDAPVGTGKTTAVMAYLLRQAKEKGLRHIFVVLPYTNIIKQSVDIYRKALVLPKENPAEIVAEHHHQADFADINLRGYSTLWKSPIIVTTAVQYFETLAAYHPARLRKLHELPGSAVFIDECHASVPLHLWPQIWEWLDVFSNQWSGNVVFASGSLCRFWQINDFINNAKNKEVSSLPADTKFNQIMHKNEKIRIVPKREIKPFTGESFINWLTNKKGPRLVIMNTIQSAALLAHDMRLKGFDVLHLSTALAPIHRNHIIDRVKERLKYRLQDWTLVATSCVEAGVDFSFGTGFRESSSVTSLIQTGGRINRNNEYATSEVWDFRIYDPPLYNDNPSFALPKKILDKMFDDNAFENISIEEILQKAITSEITESRNEKAKEILRLESEMEYPEVSQLCRVIDSDTRTVVIDRAIIKRLQNGENVTPRELQKYCVQIWSSKINNLNIKPLFDSSKDEYGLYIWEYDYDPDFLGYMQGILHLLQLKKEGISIY
jgi:CRISPR-associated endonuclease/helicase Cas3